MKTMKKIMTFLLIASMLFSLSVTAFAEEAESSSDGSGGNVEVVVVSAAPSASTASASASNAAASTLGMNTTASTSSGESGNAPAAESVRGSASGETVSAPSETGTAGTDTAASQTISAASQTVEESTDRESVASAQRAADTAVETQAGNEEAGETGAEETSADAETAGENQTNKDTDTGSETAERTKEQSAAVSTSIGDPAHTDTEIPDMPEGYTVFVDEDGVFQLTYTIAEDADEEKLTLDLSKALEALTGYGALTDTNTLQPGDSRKFRIWITSESGHTYRYEEGSFSLTTPDMDPENYPENEEDQVIGFDGQTLEELYMASEANSKREISAYLPALKQALLDCGISEYDINSRLISNYDLKQFLKKNTEEDLAKMILDYYSDKDGQDYSELEGDTNKEKVAKLLEVSNTAANDVEATPAGKTLFSVQLSRAATYNQFYQSVLRLVYGDELANEATGETVRTQETTKTVYSITDYDDGTVYESCYPANQVFNSNAYFMRTLKRYGLPEDTLISITESGGIIFGFVTKDGAIATASNSADAIQGTYTTILPEYENYVWSSDENSLISEATVAEYMKGAGNEVWESANTCFQNLLNAGVSEDEATWVSFMMAFNVDAKNAGNSFMNTNWAYENTIGLERIDGEVTVNKVDSKTGNTITGSETSFQIWQYKDDGKYFYTKTTDSETGVVTQGFVKKASATPLTPPAASSPSTTPCWKASSTTLRKR